MKLLRHTPEKTEAPEPQYTIHEEMVSDHVEELKAKAVELCRREKLVPAAWVSKYPIMGEAVVTPDMEWVMELDSGICFSIEK